MNWRKAIGAVAPVLARAVGGPVGAAALGVISGVLGIEPSEDALEKKVASLTPDDLLKLKDAERQFVVKMRELEIDVEKIDAEDRANARAREIATKDWTTRAIAITVMLLFAVTVGGLMRIEIPATNRDAVNQILGILYAAVVSVLSYYFGSSAGSRAKDSTISSMSKK